MDGIALKKGRRYVLNRQRSVIERTAQSQLTRHLLGI